MAGLATSGLYFDLAQLVADVLGDNASLAGELSVNELVECHALDHC